MTRLRLAAALCACAFPLAAWAGEGCLLTPCEADVTIPSGKVADKVPKIQIP